MSYKLSIGSLDSEFLTSSTLLREELLNLLIKNGENISSFSKLLEKDILQSVPVSIFRSKLSPLESLVVYLKSTFSLRSIGNILSRSEKTIGTTYRNALIKINFSENINLFEGNSKEHIPLSIFSNRNLSILEQACMYLVSTGLKYSEVGFLLNKDRRVVWTVCNRARKKLQGEVLEYETCPSVLLSKTEEKLIEKIKIIKEKNNFSNKYLISLLYGPPDDMIPLEIFSDLLSPLESLVFYLKKKEYSFRKIGYILARSEKTIGTTYHNSMNKLHKSNRLEYFEQKINFSNGVENLEYLKWIPLQLFSDRSLSILEHVCLYLSIVGIKLSQIGLLLNKDRRVIWTVKNRARNKLDNSLTDYTIQIKNFKDESIKFSSELNLQLSLHKKSGNKNNK